MIYNRKKTHFNNCNCMKIPLRENAKQSHQQPQSPGRRTHMKNTHRTNHLKHITSIAILAILVIAAGGCGGGGGSTSDSSVPTVLSEKTRVLDGETRAGITEVATDTITFATDTPQLQALAIGDIIASAPTDAAPYGLLKKVVAKTSNSGSTVVTVENAALADAIEQADIEVSRELTLDDVSSEEALQKGVSLKRSANLDLKSFSIELKNVLYDEDNNKNTLDDQTTITGSVTLTPSVNFKARIKSFKLESLLFTTSAKEELDIKLDSKLPLAGFKEEIPIYKFKFKPFVVNAGIPLVFVPKLTVYVGLQGKITTTLTAEIVQSAKVTAGMRYADKKWSTVKEFTNVISYDAPKVTLTAEVKAYCGLELELLLYNVAGPSAYINGYLRMLAGESVQLSEGVTVKPLWELAAGLEAGAKFQIEIFDHELESWDTGAFTITERKIAHAPTMEASPASGESPLDVSFKIDCSDDDITCVSYSWKFGDGGTSTEKNPSHTYETAGTYTAKVTVTDKDGATTELTSESITVENGLPLNVPFNITATSLDLSWSQSSKTNFAYYKVYRSTSPGVTLSSTPVNTITSKTHTTQTVTGLTKDTKYYFKVYACDTSDKCTASNEVSGTPTDEWITIPAGNFLMGCSDTSAASGDGYYYDTDDGYGNPIKKWYSFCLSDQQPRHTVNLSEYKIMKHEVTNAQYEACVAAGSCTAPGSTSSSTRASYYGNSAYANYPVINVTWTQAALFCAWYGGKLPTEAQWEKAARGPSPSTNIYPWGSTPGCYGNVRGYHDINSTYHSCVTGETNDTAAVGSYSSDKSYYGVMDMGGNVWEWVNDWYGSDYYSSSPSTDPTGPTIGDYDLRVLRGGSWDGIDYVWYSRVSVRFRYVPSNWSLNRGFRCAQD